MQRTSPVNVEFDLLLQVPTRSVKSCACACITAPAARRRVVKDTMLSLLYACSSECWQLGDVSARNGRYVGGGGAEC